MKKGIKKLITLGLALIMLFTCIPVANVFAAEIDTGFENNFCFYWAEYDSYDSYFEKQIYCDFGESITLQIEDDELMGDDLSGVSYYYYSDFDKTNQINTDVTNKSYTIESVTSPKSYYLTAIDSYGNEIEAEFYVILNDLLIDYSSSITAESGKDTLVSVKPYVENGDLNLSPFTYEWFVLDVDNTDEEYYWNNECVTTEDGTFTLNTTEDKLIKCRVLVDGMWRNECVINVKVVEPTTTESKPATTTESKPATTTAAKPTTTETKPATGTSSSVIGTVATVNGSKYKITSNSAATLTKAKKAKKVSVPATVTIKGKKYKVTSIAKNAFASNKKVTTVTIGKNVTSIGNKAFYNCTKLKKVTIKSKVLKSVSKNAFKKTNKKLVIKVPAKKKKAYKKLLVKRGFKGTLK